MKVKELIEKLKKASPEAEVYYVYKDNDGCDTCGFGASTLEGNIWEVVDIFDDVKVWLR